MSAAVPIAHDPGRDPLLSYLAHLAPSSREAAAKRLRAAARDLGVDPAAWHLQPWHELPFQRIEWLRQAMLARGAAPNTVNLTLATLKGIARYAYKLRLIDREAHALIQDIGGARGSRVPSGRAAAPGELAALLAACVGSGTPAGWRDAAIVLVLVGAGLRRAELAALTLSDYVPTPPKLRVLGKGNKEREVPLNLAIVAALDAWLAVRGDAPGRLFIALTKAGRPAGDGLTDSAVYHLLARRLKQAGLAKLSPHDLRRTFVGDLLDAKVDLSTVQRLAGHASPTTTAKYDRRGDETQRQAVALLTLPDVARLSRQAGARDDINGTRPSG